MDEACGPGSAAIVIDSREVRARFGLGDFTGQLFVHFVGAAGHDVVKYALDTFGDTDAIATERCPARTTPMPGRPIAMPGCRRRRRGERVVLWVQNSHPTPIPAGAIGLNPMGEDTVVPFAEPIGPFASRAVDVAELLPGSPGRGRSRSAPASTSCVRATRSSPAGAPPHRARQCRARRSAARPALCRSSARCWARAICCRRRSCRAASGKACCCRRRWRTSQTELPIAALVYDADGQRSGAGCRSAGCRATTRRRCRWTRLAAGLGDGHGHVELVYDFRDGGSGDGWLHALFRYRHRASGHAAETSFGAHVFNTILTYRDEPQSYVGRPPGLSTRLFLRLGEAPYDTLCHLIYPASLPWRPESATEIILHDRAGAEIARRGAGDSLLRVAAVPLSRLVRPGDPRPRRRRRLCDRARPDLPIVRLSRAVRPRRRVQPRPHVRFLTAFFTIARRRPRAAARKNAIFFCRIVRVRGSSSAQCRSSTTARS